MHEHVAASLAFDESVTFGIVEPLDLACDAHRCSSYLLGRALCLVQRPDLIACLSKPLMSFEAQKKDREC
jgi:hypothetical protein